MGERPKEERLRGLLGEIRTTTFGKTHDHPDRKNDVFRKDVVLPIRMIGQGNLFVRIRIRTNTGVVLL